MSKPISIALTGNPNSGKTTLFNRLTGSNQHIGNWPGVTVEKKEGRLKGYDDVTVVDLPGVYSLSPYTLEERITRKFLMDERPDVILNIIDGSALERSLYLTTQLAELGIPMVLAVNMADVMEKTGDVIDQEALGKALGSTVCQISALDGTGVKEVAETAVKTANSVYTKPRHFYGGSIEHALAHIEDIALKHEEPERQRYLALRLLERDEDITNKLNLSGTVQAQVEKEIVELETQLDDDSESIIANERYVFITHALKKIYKQRRPAGLTTSDKIDKVVTNRILGLPIFAIIMFLVYYLSISTVGGWATDWTNDGLFGDGFFLGKGNEAYEAAVGEFDVAESSIEAFELAADEAGIDPEDASDITVDVDLFDDEGEFEETILVDRDAYLAALTVEEPDPNAFGKWVRGVPVVVDEVLTKWNTADWLQDLVVNGIIAGVGAVLGFVPQMLVLFLCLAILEACGYMARVAFVMDRVFRKFGLSGKSFIPMLIGTGCSVPGIMATRTIENVRDRRLTIITTPFIPCSAKLPIIALIAGALFGKSAWVGASAYFVGVAAIIISGIMLKKLSMFAGDPAPFVMELPAYRLPRFIDVMRSMWERGWSFIRKAGTVILLSTIVIWFLSSYGFADGSFGAVEMNDSVLAILGRSIAWIFAPLGFGTWQATVSTVTGLIAKENVVSTFGVLFGSAEEVAENGWQIWQNVREIFTPLAAYAYLVFNLLCAPCFAAIGATKREMNSGKWTVFSFVYQTIFAYAVSLIIFQFGSLIIGQGNTIGVIAAAIVTVTIVWLLVRPAKKTLA